MSGNSSPEHDAGLDPEETPFFIAPAGWSFHDPNPFCADGGYGPEWVCFQVLDRRGTTFFTGSGEGGLFALRAERDCAHLLARVADFLRYEGRYGRKVILAAPEDIDMRTLVAEALTATPPWRVFREDDPRWLAHSTGPEAWAAIQAVGELRSLARLRREGQRLPGVGLRDLGEPPDYAEYVMLGDACHIGAELVVSSQQKGRILTDENAPYRPGVRLYVDAHRLITDGLGVRDGAHLLKVHDHLPLSPYVRLCVGAADIDPDGRVHEWTPRTFFDAANALFRTAIADFSQRGA
jgi:hypothetical protein